MAVVALASRGRLLTGPASNGMENEGKTISISPEGKVEETRMPKETLGVVPAMLPSQIYAPATKPAPPPPAQTPQTRNQTLNQIIERGAQRETGGGAGGTGSSRVVRTYEGDLALIMREKKGSVIKIALAEHRKRETEGERAMAAPKKNSIFLFSSLMAIVLSVALLGFVYFAKEDENGAATIKVESLIFAEKQKAVDASGFSQAKLIAAVKAELGETTLRLDTIENIYFIEGAGAAKEKMPTERFFGILGTRVPAVLLRSLKENFMFGIHAFNGNQPFLILKTDFYENAFLGLLKWESSLASDLLPVFGTKITSENRYLLEKDFQDVTIKNIDARALTDEGGKTVLIYTIPNKETIIIGTAEDTLNEVIGRLNAPQSPSSN